MTSPNQIAANRENARRSTGPRSARGKARAAKNAVKHGLSAERIVLSGPERARYHRRRKQWADDLRPGDEGERQLVETLVFATIVCERLDRLDRDAWKDAQQSAAEAFDRENPGPLDDDGRARRRLAIIAAFPDPQTLRTFLRHAPRWEGVFHRTLKTFLQRREARRRAPKSQNEARGVGSEIRNSSRLPSESVVQEAHAARESVEADSPQSQEGHGGSTKGGANTSRFAQVS